MELSIDLGGNILLFTTARVFARLSDDELKKLSAAIKAEEKVRLERFMNQL